MWHELIHRVKKHRHHLLTTISGHHTYNEKGFKAEEDINTTREEEKQQLNKNLCLKLHEHSDVWYLLVETSYWSSLPFSLLSVASPLWTQPCWTLGNDGATASAADLLSVQTLKRRENNTQWFLSKCSAPSDVTLLNLKCNIVHWNTLCSLKYKVTLGQGPTGSRPLIPSETSCSVCSENREPVWGYCFLSGRNRFSVKNNNQKLDWK